ncbi:hypothetical protein RCH16_000989 [Cryobacterium sp. MP_M5]|nr:hypothetical protein [Cryobacterium sp. MP_M5]
MTVHSATELQSWISDVSGEDDTAKLSVEWAEFAGRRQPVLTLFGAFDTGKSSILRRLLVEAGQPLPEWLTISARHETFAENLIEVDGCLVRDTPGLSPEGQDARSLSNSEVARSTLGLTDVLLVTLNPQLSTGERPELLEVLSMGWPPGCVWFLISRADEGGVDPTLNLDGFKEWAARKRDELRESLSLTDAHRIFVIVPDFAGLGAFESAPESSVWDSSRSWDGMDELHSALVELSGEDHKDARCAAELRFWTRAASVRLASATATVDDLKVSADVANASLQRRSLFLKQVDALVGAAEASLNGSIEDAIRRAVNNPQVDAESIQNTVDPVLEEWWQKQQVGLARIRQDAIQALDQQREGQGWAKFESVYRRFTQPAEEDATRAPSLVPRLEELGQKAIGALQGADRLWQAHLAAKQPGKVAEITKSAGKLGLAGGIASAALPVVAELASMIEDKVQIDRDKVRQREQREQLHAAVAEIVKVAADEAMRAMEPSIEALRREITAQTVEEAEVRSLEAAVHEASDLVIRGKALLSH